MITMLITLIVYVCILGLLYWLAMYVLDNVPLPEPVGRIARILVMVIIVICVIYLLLQIVNGGGLKLNLSEVQDLSTQYMALAA